MSHYLGAGACVSCLIPVGRFLFIFSPLHNAPSLPVSLSVLFSAYPSPSLTPPSEYGESVSLQLVIKTFVDSGLA